MSAVIAAALLAELVVVGGDPAACRAKKASPNNTVERPVGAMTLGHLLGVMSRNDCVRFAVPSHLLDKQLEFGASMAVIKDWRGPLQAKLDELGIKLSPEPMLRVDGPPPPATPATPKPFTAAELDQGITCKTPGHCAVARKLLDRVLAEPMLLATSVRIVPSMRDGKTDGFRLFGIRPDTLWIRLGFENGDTLQTINGEDLTSPEKALEIYSKLRVANDLTVRIVRRGQPLTLTYEIR